MRFDYEKTSLHTIVFGASVTGRTYFVRQFLKLYENYEDYMKTIKIIILCRDKRDWMDPKTNELLGEYYV